MPLRSSRFVFILRRLVGLAAVLVVISFLIFSLLYIAPGSPEQLVLGNSKSVDPATIRAVRKQYHLEGPFLVRYLDWARAALHFDFGQSIRTSEPVRQGITQRLSLTAQLAGLAFLITLAVGVPLGILAAIRRAQLVDRGVVFFSIVGLSAPAFATGILLLYLFAVRVNWFPAFGQGTGVADRLRHLVLPALALALTATGLVVKITRAAFVDELQKDYVTFARARGIRPSRVLFGFVLRNAATPIVTAAGLILAYMLAGSVLVEVTFALPGIGALLVDSVTSQDIPMVQGLAMLIAAVVVLVNLIVDLLYPVIDPRIVFSRTSS
ncbi:MAG: peptide/nickel transport system permease protein [Gaiellaceae bacterium]|nr:peptide/nickel transport system permease protein [Gaiellaceae bacterium]